MTSINRKQIEDYYEKEWDDFVSPKGQSLLIELTCQAFKLNQSPTPGFIKEKEPLKPQDLGKI